MVIRIATNKFNARKTRVSGILFDSAKEAARYEELKLAEYAGQIRDLKLQPEFELQPGFRDRNGKKHQPVKYRADFQYIEDGQIVVEDTKGFPTQTWKLKQKLFLYHYQEYVLRVT